MPSFDTNDEVLVRLIKAAKTFNVEETDCSITENINADKKIYRRN